MDFSILKGKTLTGIDVIDGKHVIFSTSEGEEYILFHDVTCCNKKFRVSILYDESKILHSPITTAKMIHSNTKGSSLSHAHTYVYYELGVSKRLFNIYIRMFNDDPDSYLSEKVFFERIR